jgi:hypothetical protein
VFQTGKMSIYLSKDRSLYVKPGGVDVMITIFGDFCQFSAKNLAFFLKFNVMIENLHNLAFVLSRNRQF